MFSLNKANIKNVIIPFSYVIDCQFKLIPRFLLLRSLEQRQTMVFQVFRIIKRFSLVQNTDLMRIILGNVDILMTFFNDSLSKKH